jgi:hypothetical protein
LLDDIISALDAHTSRWVAEELFAGPLTKNRTVILVTHHIKLLVPVAAHVVLLDNGDVKYSGPVKGFVEAGHMEELDETEDDGAVSTSTQLQPEIEGVLEGSQMGMAGGLAEADSKKKDNAENAVPARPPRKLVEDEARQTGGISRGVWKTYLQAQGSTIFWICFGVITVIGSSPPLVERYILNRWSASYSDRQPTHSPIYFITIYAIATMLGTLVSRSGTVEMN